MEGGGVPLLRRPLPPPQPSSYSFYLRTCLEETLQPLSSGRRGEREGDIDSERARVKHTHLFRGRGDASSLPEVGGACDPHLRWAPAEIHLDPHSPHGGVRPFHHKSTLPHAMNFRALCGANLVTQPSNFEATNPSRSNEWVHTIQHTDHAIVFDEEPRAHKGWRSSLQGYLAHKKTPPPLGPP